MFVTLPALPRPTVVSLPARCVRLGSATGHAPNPAPRIVSGMDSDENQPSVDVVEWAKEIVAVPAFED